MRMVHLVLDVRVLLAIGKLVGALSPALALFGLVLLLRWGWLLFLQILLWLKPPATTVLFLLDMVLNSGHFSSDVGHHLI